jgi:hypothetical protein
MASNINRRANKRILKLEADDSTNKAWEYFGYYDFCGATACIYFGAGELGIGSRLPFVTRGLIEFSAWAGVAFITSTVSGRSNTISSAVF